jgi:transcriptional antiterminator NusG
MPQDDVLIEEPSGDETPADAARAEAVDVENDDNALEGDVDNTTHVELETPPEESALEAEAASEPETETEDNLGPEDDPATEAEVATAEAETEADTEAAEEAEEEDVQYEALVPLEDIPDSAAWYVVHTYSGYENKVKRNLEYRVESSGLNNRIFRIVVPVEEEVDIKEGQRRVVERRVFPGYVFVQMLMDDQAWDLVHNTPGVTSFVGSGTRPTPLRDAEVERILRRIEAEEPTVRVSFREGQRVRIVDGPFSDFHGVVDEIDMERGKVRLLVSFFGRETPVELDLLQVEKG